MSDHHLVSILIPTYQGENFLAETLSSALSQTYPHVEIIISDDGSSDRTLEIAKTFQEKSPHEFKILSHLNNGIVDNWNYCLAQAQGKYIKFLFQDDLITPDCLEKMVDLAKEDPEIGLVFSPREMLLSGQANAEQNCIEIYKNSQNVHTYWSNLKAIQLGQDLLKDPNWLNQPMNKIGEPSTVLIKREVFNQIGTFDSEFMQLVDWEMWTRIMVHYKIGFVDQTLSYFRIHPEQQSVKNMKEGESEKDDIRFYRKLMTASCYNSLPESLKVKVYEKIETKILQLINDKKDFQHQRDRGITRIQQLEAHEAELEAELRKTQADFFQIQFELEQAHKTLQKMGNSQFWKLKKAWHKLKRTFQ